MKDVRPMSGDGYAIEGFGLIEGDGCYSAEGDGYAIDLNPVGI